MISFASHTPTYPAGRPAPQRFAAQAPAAQFVASMAAPKFGSCVNANTEKAEFQNILLMSSLNMRLHAIASSGMTGKQEFAEVLSNMFLRQNEFNNPSFANNIQVNEFTLGALVEAAEKNPGLKPMVLETLEKAKKARHLAALYRTIDDAIKKVKGEKHAPQKLAQIQQAMEANRQHRMA